MPPNTTPHRPALQTRVAEVPHPSEGRGNPYSQDMRTLVTAINQLGPLPNNVQDFIETLRLNRIYPSHETEERWNNTHAILNHARPCRRTGNNFATRLRGVDLIHLALYRVAFPKASHAEINAYLYRVNLGNPEFRFYSHSQISEAETRIGLSKKRGSTTAYQAFFPQNLDRRWEYWNLPYPVGVSNVPRRRMIDLDECGLHIKSANRGTGKAYVGVRVRDAGPYSNADKWTLLMAVCGEDGSVDQPSRRWANIWNEGGTTITRMLDFVRQILNDIGPAGQNNFHCFTMDNLSSHRNDAVVALIQAFGHGVVYRAPYWNVDGSIEYVFNTLQCLLRRRLHEVQTDEELIQAVYEAIQSMIDFGSYFRHVGFVVEE